MKIITDKQIKHKAAVAYAFGKIHDRLYRHPLLVDMNDGITDDWGVETYELDGYYLRVVDIYAMVGKGMPDSHEWEVVCHRDWFGDSFTLYGISEEDFVKGV
jgi:hypothetical protein